jgi:hypothetical protein
MGSSVEIATINKATAISAIAKIGQSSRRPSPADTDGIGLRALMDAGMERSLA